MKAPKSSVIRITTPGSFQPISYSARKWKEFLKIFCTCISKMVIFYADMIFNDETENMLKEEIAEIGDSMTFQINFYSAADDRLIGQAVVELWVMIEDCCNIVRKVGGVNAYHIISRANTTIFLLLGDRYIHGRHVISHRHSGG